ncbi:MAG: transposase [Magnetococcales bacterium]|nr:transposase [Magnetococcales bacterium]
MLNMLSLFLVGITSTFRSKAALQIEILALRHQIIVMQRKQKQRLMIRQWDRLFWVWLSRIWPNWQNALMIFKPSTVLKWHREGFRLYWKWKSSKRSGGRKSVPKDVRDLIKRMSLENPLWGAPHIHGELMKLGYSLAQSSVSRHMVKPKKHPSQTWKTFLKNHASQIVAMDFFTIPDISFKVLYVLIFINHDRRKIIHFNVTTNPTASWVAQQIREAFPRDTAPRFLLHDRAPAFQAECRTTLRAMGIEEVITAPASPWQNPYAERMIGSIRRDVLDHIITLNEEHLRQTLANYFVYYHGFRTHLGLKKDCPDHRPVQPTDAGKIVAVPHLGGLHHQYLRKAA